MNKRPIYYCSIVSIICTAIIIVTLWIGEINITFFNFSIICSIAVSVSITAIEIIEYVKSGWFSYTLSFRNDRLGTLCSLVLIYYFNIIVSVMLVVLIISLYDCYIILQLLRIIIFFILVSSVVFSTLLLLYVGMGRYVYFALLIPIMSVIGCILTYITIVYPSIDYMDNTLICILLVISILNHVISFLKINRTDFS